MKQGKSPGEKTRLRLWFLLLCLALAIGIWLILPQA